MTTQSNQWRTQGGEWGVRTPPPTFQKVGPQDSHKNVIKLVGGGVAQICQEVVSEILEKQAQNGFSRVRSKVLLPKKCLNTAGRGILSQSRMLIVKNFPGVLPTDPLIVISQLEHATGIPVCCLG